VNPPPQPNPNPAPDAGRAKDLERRAEEVKKKMQKDLERKAEEVKKKIQKVLKCIEDDPGSGFPHFIAGQDRKRLAPPEALPGTRSLR
jgi:hypothetical protein